MRRNSQSGSGGPMQMRPVKEPIRFLQGLCNEAEQPIRFRWAYANEACQTTNQMPPGLIQMRRNGQSGSSGPMQMRLAKEPIRAQPRLGAPASRFWPPGEPPKIVTDFPQNVAVAVDGDVVLGCKATGKPEPLVTWTKVDTGALLAPNTRVGRFEVRRDGTLVIRGAAPEDRGRYACAAQNLHGAARKSLALSVDLQAPRVVPAPEKDVTVSWGDTVSLACLARGTPTPRLSWIFPDGLPGPRETPGGPQKITVHPNKTLTIRGADFSDRGVYKCVASNAAGVDVGAVRLHVAAQPPEIREEKAENVSVAPGVGVRLPCSARGAPAPQLRWVLPDGAPLRPSQALRGRFYVLPDGALYVRRPAPRDGGRYDCVADSTAGSARRSVWLAVEPQNSDDDTRAAGGTPESADVDFGATLRLPCGAAGHPEPRVLWRLPSMQTADVSFSPDPRVQVFPNGTLVVNSMTQEDAGDYLCMSRREAGDDFALVRVRVATRPAHIEPGAAGGDQQVLDGADLRVDCVASGLPSPDITWTLPDGSLANLATRSNPNAQRYAVFRNGTLFLHAAGPADAGEYICVAENRAGRDEMRVRIRVLSAPAAILDKTYSVLEVPYGDVATVTCEAQGDPAPLLNWLSPTHHRIPESSEKYRIDDRGTLMIRKTRRSDSGNYTCVVRNRGGEDRKTVWLHVQVSPPKINGHPNAVTAVREVAVGGSRKLIHCKAEGVPAPRVLWAFPQGVVLPAPYFGNRVSVHRNGTLDIRSLRRSDAVQLACIGRNEGGEARLLVQLTVLDAVDAPSFRDPPREEITATAGHTISLGCSLDGRTPATRSWRLPDATELRAGQRRMRFHHASADGRLHIAALASTDAGVYRCEARNAAGQAERLVVLTVGQGPPQDDPRYRNLVSILHGETLTLRCPSPDAGVPRFSWTLPSGQTLDRPQIQGRYSLFLNGTLAVRNASVFDRGTYICRADSNAGPRVTSFPVIVMAYAPRLTGEDTPVVHARRGSSVTLPCLAVGLPKPELTWEFPDGSKIKVGGQARSFGHRLLHAQGTLTVQHVTPKDAGPYKCSATNVLGSDSRTTDIQVY
ncbi:matrix-remodeling-associated protein 5 [Suncus etruscus]|uniref:matrix-remodeling-associated protein 5 n=1 Tax=Suncus etruscus TaxID=109475 RepID=UPI00210F3911|nr:matrix-remodeling-associated protein 5 [Suncus etruscus]